MYIVIVCIAVFGWLCMMPNLIWEGFMRKIPKPPEHLRPKKNGSVPRMRNLPLPPIKEGNCYLDCGNTRPSPGPDVICLNCGSSIKRPEFPKDRIE